MKDEGWARRSRPFNVVESTFPNMLPGGMRKSSIFRSRRSALIGIDLETARIHARVWAVLSARGELIGPHDLWLGAARLARGLRMVTSNVREFARVPGLELEDWSPRAK